MRTAFIISASLLILSSAWAEPNNKTSSGPEAAPVLPGIFITGNGDRRKGSDDAPRVPLHPFPPPKPRDDLLNPFGLNLGPNAWDKAPSPPIVTQGLKARDLDAARGVGAIISDIVKKPNLRWTCTAFCVADDVIGTSAHCLTKAKGGRLPTLDSFQFRLSDLYISGKEPERILSGWVETTTLKGVDERNPHLAIYSGYDFRRPKVGWIGKDWAFAKLRRPICRNKVLSLAPMSEEELIAGSNEGRVYMIAYHSTDKQLRPKVSRNCTILSKSDRKRFPGNLRRMLRRDEGIVVHDCFSRKGSSGGPVFLKTHEGPKVIAINAGEITLKRRRLVKRVRVGNRIKPTFKVTRRQFKSAAHPDAFIDGIERFKNEKLLNSLEEFEEVQSLLKRLHLYRGSIDGELGPMTKRALLRYEKRAGLEPIGVPTQRLLSLLRAEFGPVASGDESTR